VLRRFPLLFLPVLLSQCGLVRPPAPVVRQPFFRVDQGRYDALKPADARITIDLAAQKARLTDRSGEIALETDVSTGKPGHDTPAGTFRVMEKIEDKRSNLYGRYKDSKSGLDLGSSLDHPKPPKDAVYEGYAMPYWMRLTHDGIGIHVGQVIPGEPVSFGCVRVPATVQPLLFAKAKVGTRVEILAETSDEPVISQLPPR
jgi:lipoprotein-anchoring transpeptidase ErfK/SrfK